MNIYQYLGGGFNQVIEPDPIPELPGDTPEAVIFDRIIVDHAMPAGARVSWRLAPHFLVSGARSFQLQASNTGEVTNDDWVDVGSPTQGWVAVDDTRRRRGIEMDVVYRVVLTIGSQAWASRPAPSFGLLSEREWLLAKGIIRRRELKYNLRDAVEGWLFKRRDVGDLSDTATTEELPDLATDEISGLVLNSRQPVTVGTEYVGGYYPPVPLRMQFSNYNNQIQREDQRNMVNEGVMKGECLAFPQMDARDVWVAKHDDRRYYLNPVSTVAELRQVPLVITCELRVAPVTDAIYQLDL